MFIIKLGGSVITKKAQKAQFQKKIMDDLATQIQRSQQQVILVHGAGSFGHGYAKEYSLHTGYHDEQQKNGFALTQRMVQQLNSMVLASLQDKNLAAVSIPPHTATLLDDGKLSWFQHDIFNQYLSHGFLPVTYGDVALDKKHVFTICSGDQLMIALADQFKPERIIFVLDEDGLYTANPKLDDQAAFIESITADELDELETTIDHHPDVTEGMAGKIQTIKKLAQLQVDTSLINGNHPERLYKVLMGKPTKQTIVHWRNPK